MRTLLALFFLLTLTACGPEVEVDPTLNWSAEQLYFEAKTQLDEGNFLTAIEYFENLESRYPFGRFAIQAQIEVAYAYYQYDEPDSAVASLERFIKLHPRHESVDYAYYLKGVVNFERGGTIMDVLSERDIPTFDKSLMLTSFNDFNLLISRFPQSRYAADARQRMVFLKNELARADLRTAEYYATREAWVAVANRTQQIIKDYQGTTSIKPALDLQLQAYEQLGFDDLKRDTQRIIDLNFGQSS